MPHKPPVHRPPGTATRQEQRRLYDRSRDRQVWRGWYKTARWQRLRWSILVRDRFTCRMCDRMEPDTSRLVADHVEPHRGNATLFWNDQNLQCLCKACHDTEKQRKEHVYDHA